MTWGTLTAANGYTIGVHASSSDGGDWGMCYKGRQISMQLDGWYYQNEGRYRVVDTSDLASYNPTSNFKTINNQSIIGTGNINIEGGGVLYDAEIEYLESTGTQYIDLGIIPNVTDSIYCEFMLVSPLISEDGSANLFGTMTAWSTNAFALTGSPSSSSYNVFFLRGNNAIGNTVAWNDVSDIWQIATINSNTATFLGQTFINDSTASINLSAYLFAVNINGYAWGLGSIKRIRKFQYKRNNELIRDFIPVRVGNVGYLYDKVSGQLFGNSGTGDFVLGQDTGPGGGLPYLPLTGGTITGNLTVNGILTASNGNLDIISGGGIAVVFEVQNSLDVMFNGGFEYFFDAKISAPAFNNTSDLRKKTIMGDVPMNIYNVANAPLFKFTWNNETKYSGQHIGSAAQYWQTVLPELVSIGRDADMTLAMQYDVIALASAITVAKTVVNHEERIILLERENEALKKEIADLKSA